ncbi:MAG: HAMP domain-containing protein [Deltaproteobacteria bacterium]|nr:HAMP domain-containing protein [Deltaproteobacteria bacterium]
MSRISISIKYSLLILFTVLATSGLLFWFFADLLHQEVEDQLHKRGDAMVSQMAYSASSLLLARDDAKLQAVVNKAREDPDIVSLSVINVDNKVVADSEPSRIGTEFFDPHVPIGQSKCMGFHHDTGRNRFVFMQRSSFSDTPVGCVIVQLSGEVLTKAVAGATSRVLLITALIAMTVILLSFLTLRRTLRPLARVIEGTRKISAGDFSTRLELRSKDEIGDLAESFNTMAARTQLFFRYVDKFIAERLSHDETLVQPGGQLKQISVLFGDMRDFTAMSNRMPPSDVVHILNTYFDLFFQLVHHFSGVVDKTMGDAIMAFFEAFETKETGHSERATLAAVAMSAAVSVMKETIRAAAEHAIPLRVDPCSFGFSVATGRLIVGNIGTEEHMDYTVCGPAVNLASRLQQDTGHGEIILDRFTAMDVEHIILSREMQRVQPKGFSATQAVTPYRVVGIREVELARLRQLMRRLFTKQFFLARLVSKHEPGGRAIDEATRKVMAFKCYEIASDLIERQTPDFLDRR